MPLKIIDVRIPKLTDGSQPKLKELVSFLQLKLQHTITSRSSQIEEKLSNWSKNYNCEPKQKTRTTPFYGASNFVSGLIRMHTDIYHARTVGFLFGVKPFWMPTYFTGQLKHQWLNACADWMEYTCFNRMKFFEPIDAAIHDAFKLGTVVMKMPWVEKELWRATSEVEGKTEQSKQSFKKVELSPIPHSDFLPYPITASSLDTVEIKFHRLRFTEEQVRYRKNVSWWDKDAVDMLLMCKDGKPADSVTGITAQWSGIQLTPDVARPFQVIEAHLNYELETGKLFPIVVIFNPAVVSDKAVLRVYHKYYNSLDLDEFVDFRFWPRNDLFYGDSIPQILEGIHEEHTQLHCDRRDASTIANIPTFKKKRFSDVASPKDEWYPGKVFELDNMQDLDVLSLAASYNHMIEEEGKIEQLAEKLVGNPPPTQGAGTGQMGKKSGTYVTGGTFALIAQGNQRLDLGVMRFRSPFNKVGRVIYESFRDFGDEGQYYIGKGNDEALKKVFEFQPPEGFPTPWFGLNASNSSSNRESERSGLLLMANTLSGYYHQIFELLSTVVQAPADSPVQKLGLLVLDGAKDIADQILRAFNIPDRPDLVPDVREVLGGKQPPNGPQPTGVPGSPQPQGAVSPEQLQSLSSTIGAIAGANRQGANGGGRPQ